MDLVRVCEVCREQSKFDAVFNRRVIRFEKNLNYGGRTRYSGFFGSISSDAGYGVEVLA